jgi:hypothetical protein
VEAAAASARQVRRGGEAEACDARTAGRNRCEEAHFNWRTCSHSMRTVSSSSLRPLPPARGRGALARIACAPCREARSARCRLAAAAALGRGLVAAAILHQILHTQQATGLHVVLHLPPVLNYSIHLWMPHLNLMVKRCEPKGVGLATPARRSSSQAGRATCTFAERDHTPYRYGNAVKRFRALTARHTPVRPGEACAIFPFSTQT